MFDTQDNGVTRVHLDPVLPCGMWNCHKQACCGLAAPNVLYTGLWELVPICDTCFAKLHALKLQALHQNLNELDDGQHIDAATLTPHPV